MPSWKQSWRRNYQPDQNDEAKTHTPDVEGESASEVIEDADEIFFGAHQTIEDEFINLIGTDERSERINVYLFKKVTQKETLEAYIHQANGPEGSRGPALWILMISFDECCKSMSKVRTICA